jgi:phospholipid/cholesterol/gamma-HCH transport system permease protein
VKRLYSFLANLGHTLTNFLEVLGGIIRLGGQTFKQSFTRPVEMHETIRQIDNMALGSVSIALITLFAVGAVMALQFAVGLDRFGGRDYVSVVVALSILRELGPVLTAVVVGGRVGSGIAAELGAMAVTEQIDAIRALGSNPVKKLVVPRMWAMLIALPSLALLADFTGILGGLAISTTELGLLPMSYISDTIDGIKVTDLISGLAKTYFFAVGIVLISCYYGIKTFGGTEGVGRSTTKTVVVSLIFIFVSDFFLTRILLIFE